MKKILITCLCAFLFYSCAETDLPESGRQVNQSMKKIVNDNYLLKKKFAIALHKAMTDNTELRKFIKSQALKQFDNDYDVLYNYVKNNPVGES